MPDSVQNIQTHRFSNGLTLIVESMPWLESVAFAASIPGGCQVDPANRLGLGNFTCEMVQRGCGDRTSRQFVESLERLGTDISASVSISHSNFGASMPAASIYNVLDIFKDLVRSPHMPEDQLEEGRSVCLQEVSAIEDDLSQKTLIELRRRSYPQPYGRSATGTADSIAAISAADIRQYWESFYQPQEMILSVAGKTDFKRLCDHVETIFSDWKPKSIEKVEQKPTETGHFHIDQQSNQTHIGLSYPSVPYSHPDYFRARGSVGVLSDGMSSRLFTEVREKRGLCYTVYASMHSMKERGSIIVYAGTSADRAQETLDVTVAEIQRLSRGIQQSELDRLKVSIRSSLVMQQESSRSRAASMAGDWFHLGRVRTLEELTQIINSLTVQEINHYLAEHPPQNFKLVSLGPTPLEEPSGVSTASA